MKPPHSGRHGGGGRPPSDRGSGSGGPSRHPGQPNDRQQRPNQGASTLHARPQGPHAPRQDGPRPPGKAFPNRPQDNQHRDRPRNDYRPDRQRDHTSRPHTPDTPRGAIWLYGLHAVAAALANPSRRLRHLMLTEEAQQTLAQRQPPPWPLPPEQVERGRLDHLLGRDIAHQGAALLADPLATPSLQHALERPGPLIVLDQVTDPRNVGAILRSAAAFGVAAVITQDRNAPDETGALAKAASGALETVPLLRAVNIARTLIALKAAGIWTVGLDTGGATLSGPVLGDRRVALVLGAEGEGLRRLTRETCDEIAGLRMPGKMDSLNVSAAATVALYELTRRS
ncbi:MAG TPA: RNA methyltransferase [Acetobacteraceae bacterium]|nr:RNA methyltransferase [Acetobacteraceae bacterium]